MCTTKRTNGFFPQKMEFLVEKNMLLMPLTLYGNYFYCEDYIMNQRKAEKKLSNSDVLNKRVVLSLSSPDPSVQRYAHVYYQVREYTKLCIFFAGEMSKLLENKIEKKQLVKFLTKGVFVPLNISRTIEKIALIDNKVIKSIEKIVENNKKCKVLMLTYAIAIKKMIKDKGVKDYGNYTNPEEAFLQPIPFFQTEDERLLMEFDDDFPTIFRIKRNITNVFKDQTYRNYVTKRFGIVESLYFTYFGLCEEITEFDKKVCRKVLNMSPEYLKTLFSLCQTKKSLFILTRIRKEEDRANVNFPLEYLIEQTSKDITHDTFDDESFIAWCNKNKKHHRYDDDDVDLFMSLLTSGDDFLGEKFDNNLEAIHQFLYDKIIEINENHPDKYVPVKEFSEIILKEFCLYE